MQLQPSLKETGSVCSNMEARERAAEGFITYIILRGMSKETPPGEVSGHWNVYRLELKTCSMKLIKYLCLKSRKTFPFRHSEWHLSKDIHLAVSHIVKSLSQVHHLV